MTLAFDVGGCSVLVEPSDQGRKPQPVTAHNRHYVRAPSWVRPLERPQIVPSGTPFCVTSDGGFDCFYQVSESAVEGIDVLLRRWIAVGAFRAVARKPVLQPRQSPFQTGHRTTAASLCSKTESRSWNSLASSQRHDNSITETAALVRTPCEAD